MLDADIILFTSSILHAYIAANCSDRQRIEKLDNSLRQHTRTHSDVCRPGRAIPIAAKRTVDGFDGRLCLSGLDHNLFLFESLRALAELCLPETTVHTASDSNELLMCSLLCDLTISQYDDVIWISALATTIGAELASIGYRPEPMSDKDTCLCPIYQGRVDIPHQFRFGIYVKRTRRLVKEQDRWILK